jgi:hypothetical protein
VSYSRVAILAVFVIGVGAPSFAQRNIERIFARNAVWISERTPWQQDPGEPKQSWADATILYFGPNGKFGMFNAVVIRGGGRMSLADEGESVSSGSWTPRGGAIQLSYRLIAQYKIMRPVGASPPEIPGPIQDAEATFKPEKNTGANAVGYLEFRDEKFKAAAGFRISELTSRLQVDDPKAASGPH